MKTKLLVAAAMTAVAFTSSLPLLAESSANDIPAHAPGGGQSIEPGKVGPGSEKNSQISPTSPSIPIDKQPPPEISLPANSSSGSSSGEKGTGPEGTSPPHNPSSPGLQ
ncbi:hypothetical protein [Hyphomicrobium sp.]|jgi:hypothetical protein|uniref:hypothetical protein n=1 Tax=Hyphomicrobium sp. TaxID=82 RepID=UPI0035614BB4